MAGTHSIKLVRALADHAKTNSLLKDTLGDIADALRAVCESLAGQCGEMNKERDAYLYETAAKDLADISEQLSTLDKSSP